MASTLFRLLSQMQGCMPPPSLCWSRLVLFGCPAVGTVESCESPHFSLPKNLFLPLFVSLLSQLYLEDFHRFCKSVGGDTATVMCELLVSHPASAPRCVDVVPHPLLSRQQSVQRSVEHIDAIDRFLCMTSRQINLVPSGAECRRRRHACYMPLCGLLHTR